MRLPLSVTRPLLRSSAGWFAPGRLPIELQRGAMDFAGGLPSTDRVQSGEEGGVRGEWHRHGDGRGRGLLYLHGGGYTLGSPRTHRGAAARLARALTADAFVADYRLAPEHRYPAALDDAVAAYTALAARFDRVLVAGDSAGGGLALAIAMRARDTGLPAPAALGLICPWLDLSAEHVDTGDALLTPASLHRFRTAYAPPPLDRRAPGMSPLFGDLSGLPPIVMHSAGDDPLLSDAERLAALVAVDHRRHPGMFHAFHILTGLLAEADAALDTFAADLRAALASPRAAAT